MKLYFKKFKIAVVEIKNAIVAPKEMFAYKDTKTAKKVTISDFKSPEARN